MKTKSKVKVVYVLLRRYDESGDELEAVFETKDAAELYTYKNPLGINALCIWAIEEQEVRK